MFTNPTTETLSNMPSTCINGATVNSVHYDKSVSLILIVAFITNKAFCKHPAGPISIIENMHLFWCSSWCKVRMLTMEKSIPLYLSIYLKSHGSSMLHFCSWYQVLEFRSHPHVSFWRSITRIAVNCIMKWKSTTIYNIIISSKKEKFIQYMIHFVKKIKKLRSIILLVYIVIQKCLSQLNSHWVKYSLYCKYIY